MDLHKRRKASPRPQTGLRKVMPLFPLFPPILSWDASYELLVFMEFVYFPGPSHCLLNFSWGSGMSYELLCFMEFVYFLVHYRSCSYQDQGHFFWGIYQLPAFPQEVVLSIPLISYMSVQESWVGSPANLSTSLLLGQRLPAVISCSLSVGRCSQIHPWHPHLHRFWKPHLVFLQEEGTRSVLWEGQVQSNGAAPQP